MSIKVRFKLYRDKTPHALAGADSVSMRNSTCERQGHEEPENRTQVLISKINWMYL